MSVVRVGAWRVNVAFFAGVPPSGLLLHPNPDRPRATAAVTANSSFFMCDSVCRWSLGSDPNRRAVGGGNRTRYAEGRRCPALGNEAAPAEFAPGPRGRFVVPLLLVAEVPEHIP